MNNPKKVKTVLKTDSVKSSVYRQLLKLKVTQDTELQIPASTSTPVIRSYVHKFQHDVGGDFTVKAFTWNGKRTVLVQRIW